MVEVLGVQQPREPRTNAMPRVTRGLWSAMAQAFDDEARAADDARAREELTRLQLEPAYVRSDDFAPISVGADPWPLGPAADGLAEVVNLDDYRRRPR